MGREDVSRRMAQAARDLEDQSDPEATYVMAAALAVTNVDGCDVAALTMVRRRREVETRGATHADAVEADRLQYELGQGPCLDAAWDHPVVLAPSLAHDPRWPRWGPRVVAGTGLESVLAFRLFTHHDTLGALNLYSYRRDAFTDVDQEDGLAVAAHIAVAVTAAEQVDNLTTALSTRTLIGQATGIVMERYGLTADVAFRTLARISAADEIKVRDLAITIIDGRRLPS